MKKLAVLITVLLSLLFTLVTVNGEGSSTVTIHFLDEEGNSLKEDVTNTYLDLTSVELSLSLYEIEGYELDEIDQNEWLRVEGEKLVVDLSESNREIELRFLKLYKYTVNYLLSDEGSTTLIKTVVKQAKEYESIPKASDIEEIEGYYFIGNNIAEVVKEETSVVDITYGLASYYIHFDLMGGSSGPETIYQKYGTKIENLEIPYKEGFEFVGWFKESELVNKIDLDNFYVQGEKTYYAGYIEKYEEALVTIVYYGENANDDNYSYLGKEEKYLQVGSTYTFDSNTQNEFIHKHDLSCFGVSDLKHTTIDEVTLNGFKLLSPSLEDGYIYLRIDKGLVEKEFYYYKYDGYFYLTDKEHISYQIGDTQKLKDIILNDEFRLFKPAFTCNSSYEFDHADAITVHESDNLVYVYLKRTVYTLSFGDSRYYPNKTYGTIEGKWGQMIYPEYDEISSFTSGTYGWSTLDSLFSPSTKVLISMPKEFCNYYRSDKDAGVISINYLVKINGEYKKIYRTNWPLTTYHTTDSDYIEIEGYVLNEKLSITKKEFLQTGEDKNNIYYDPKEYDLVLVTYVDESVSYKVAYGSLLSSNLEASLYRPTPRFDYQSFAGWYLEQDLTGEEIDFQTKIMSAHNLTLFAKWDKAKFNVRFIDDNKGIDKTIEVAYGELIDEEIVNDDPNFKGYVIDGTSTIVNFNTYKVVKDVVLYALYDNDEFINYSVNYILEDGTKVASTTLGSSIEGVSIYVYPKSSLSLDYPYKGEYKPEQDFYTFTITCISNEFNIIYKPISKYNLTLKPLNLEENDSIILFLSGKGFNNLEVVLNKDLTITGLYENENYTITFDNSYSKTYKDLNAITFNNNTDTELVITLTKIKRDYFSKETHKLNIFNKL